MLRMVSGEVGVVQNMRAMVIFYVDIRHMIVPNHLSRQ